jgi:hypothetical protein
MEVSGQLHAVAPSLPRKEPQVSNRKKARRVPKVVWMPWRREKSISPASYPTKVILPTAQSLDFTIPVLK